MRPCLGRSIRNESVIEVSDIIIYEICFYAGLEHDAFISPVVYSGYELSQGRIRSTPFFKHLEQEGIPI